ncbi:23S rRNA (guanosine(2251)-2'-O)-methyltransferase RlmB [Mycoplasmopsis agalactiae]|nr:23S rRNA (guanosine(2251)-2'-O)-methyltransferase RlmB [Mycoplasmopsis agalactiae]MCE6091190.1 23S rRNA (guanosine(2251)-2'-O)-methyltransferase RlmB [Mycoplasmopsis agalactiae]
MKKLYMCGKNSVIDAIKAKLPIEAVYVLSKSHADKLKEFSNIKIVVKDASFFKEYNSENHQGYLVFLKDFNYYEIDVIKKDNPKNVLILDHIHDPHNLGAIIRTANAAGIKHIIIPKDRSTDVNSTVLKVSSGGFVGVKIIKVSNIASSIEKLKKWGFWIYSSLLDENAVPYNKVQYTGNCALVVGNEEKGVSKPVVNATDVKVYIPQFGTVQSMNVSVATGILLFELVNRSE